MPRGEHLHISLLPCATLHLQGIKPEPPESTEKKDKKIGPNENQKHRLFRSLARSPFLSLSHLLLLLRLLPWTWKDERGGELKLIQTSSLQRQMIELWSVSVRVWVFCSLILSLLPLSSPFLWTKRESLEALRFNHLLTGLMSTAPSKGQRLYFFSEMGHYISLLLLQKNLKWNGLGNYLWLVLEIVFGLVFKSYKCV